MTVDHIEEDSNRTNLEPTTVQKLRGLPWSIGFDTANTFFVHFTFFGSAFVLFLNDLGLNKTQIGFLLSIFPFLGLISLLIAPRVAQFGYKRTFITFFGIRNLFTACLLFTPLVVDRFRPQGVFLYLAGITVAFSICRATAMTALLPWQQEYIPNGIRGKYSAYSNIFISLTGLLAVAIAGYLLGHSPTLGRYILLFGLGVVFGFISIYLASFIPGGAPTRSIQTLSDRLGDMLVPVRDRSFMLFLLGIGLFTLATGPMFSFLPLFMQERVGLSSGNVVFLQTGSMIGSLMSSYFWGWMADRYGSRPVMLSGLFLIATLPIWWLIMPRQSGVSLYVALVIALLQGIAVIGWGIGSGRLMYVSIVPPEKNAPYLAQYNAWTGLIGGASQLLGGRILDVFSGIRGDFLGFAVDSYTILFAAGFLLPVIASLIFRSVRAENEVSLGTFAGMFLQGNPLLAMESLIRYNLARNEPAAVSVTERLGRARSPLTVGELLDTLEDPRFYVRFEAIVSIARRGPDDRLMEALVRVLDGNDPALSVIAAWALGRIGDRRAIVPLRMSLEGAYRSVKAHAARSLATLGDTKSVPIFLERLAAETDPGLQVAYASALGKLQAVQATPQILSLLRQETNPSTRNELSLALARLVGDENVFIQLLRNVRSDPGTTLAQALDGFRRKIGSLLAELPELAPVVDGCAEILARDDLEAGSARLVTIVSTLPQENFCPHCWMVLQDCAQQIEASGTGRMEYIILAIFTLEEGYRPVKAEAP